MYKHWHDMELPEQIDLLKDLANVVKQIPVDKLNMNDYVSFPYHVRNEEITPQSWHTCGSAFCVLGWVATDERFGKAFNVGLKNGWTRTICDTITAAPPWFEVGALASIFDCQTASPPYTEAQRDEVLGRIDNLRHNLQMQHKASV